MIVRRLREGSSVSRHERQFDTIGECERSTFLVETKEAGSLVVSRDPKPIHGVSSIALSRPQMGARLERAVKGKTIGRRAVRGVSPHAQAGFLLDQP